MEKLLLTVAEAAEALGLSRWKLYALLRSGRLRSGEAGRFSSESLPLR